MYPLHLQSRSESSPGSAGRLPAGCAVERSGRSRLGNALRAAGRGPRQGTWDQFAPTEEKTHIAIGGGTGAHGAAAPGVPQGAPVSTKVPSEAVRETSQVKHSSAEVQVEVKERH